MGVRCNYCGGEAQLVTGEVIYPTRDALRTSKFWLCRSCDAYVGCHGDQGDGSVPLGTLANAQLRHARKSVHRAFDNLWKSGAMDRAEAYRWLGEALAVPPQDCHIGMFDLDRCERALVAIRQRATDR
jgi:hypothetical protein